jgi:DNA polymerase-3 subunit beta
MKIQISASDLNNMVQTASNAIDTKPSVSYMGGILLEAEGNTIKATATSGILTISNHTNGEVLEEGTILVDGKMLCQLSAKLPEGIATLETIGGKDVMTVKCKGSKTTLSTFPTEDFRKPEVVEPTIKLTVTAQKLRWILRGVQYAVAQNESRQVLTGVLLSAKNGVLMAVGLDGFRMAAYKSECACEGEAELIVNFRGAKELLKLASKTDGEMELVSDGNKICVTADNTEISAILLAGKYIDYKAIVPKNSTTTVLANVKEVHDAVERAMLVENKNSLVRFDIENNEITVQSRGDFGEMVETIPCSVQGENIKIAFNGKYLKECLSVIEEENANFAITTPTAPMVVKPSEGSGYIHMVLPVRTQEN